MVNQDVLEEVCSGLELLMKKYKSNSTPGDKDKYETTKKAHSSLRKVILMMAIKGDIQSIEPIQTDKKVGWMVLDLENKTRDYCA